MKLNEKYTIAVKYCLYSMCIHITNAEILYVVFSLVVATKEALELGTSNSTLCADMDMPTNSAWKS